MPPALSGVKERYHTSRAHQSDALSALVLIMLNNIASLMVRSFIERSAVSPFCFGKSNTCLMSHLPVVMSWLRWTKRTPFISQEARGCLPI